MAFVVLAVHFYPGSEKWGEQPTNGSIPSSPFVCKREWKIGAVSNRFLIVLKVHSFWRR
jgi:hypothetical protein